MIRISVEAVEQAIIKAVQVSASAKSMAIVAKATDVPGLDNIGTEYTVISTDPAGGSAYPAGTKEEALDTQLEMVYNLIEAEQD